MEFTKEDITNRVNDICDIIEDGNSLRYALKELNTSSKSFYLWIDEDKELAKQYARATKIRAEIKFDSIEEDYSETPRLDPETGRIDSAWVQLQRLKIDAKKWELSKLNPKKYGNTPEDEEKEETNDHIVNVTIVHRNQDDD